MKPRSQTAFIGRDSEREMLMNSLASACSGNGQAVVISGEPGIGKSTLVSELVNHAKEHFHFNVAVASASSSSLEPFLVFSQALDQITGERIFDLKEHVKFDAVFIIDGDANLVASASSDGNAFDRTHFPDMFNAVQGFVKDSFGGQEAGLGRLEFGDMKILMEKSGTASVVATFSGNEHPEMRRNLKLAAERLSLLSQTAPGMVQEEVERLASLRFLVHKRPEDIRLDSERARISGKVLDALRSSAEKKPLMVVLEDLHWADESSLLVLQYVARNLSGSNVFLLATARPSEGPDAQAALAAMRDEGTILDINLGGFDALSVQGLADSMFQPNDFSRAFVEKLHRDCAGNPFFISEILNQMFADRAIAHDGEKFTLGSQDYVMPSSIEEVVERRLGSLDSDSLAMAEYASCVGRVFPVDIVLSCSYLQDPGGSLEKLGESGIIGMENDRGEFAHALFQAAVYGSLSSRWRMAYHKSLGEHYELKHAGQEDNVVYELARHFAETSEHSKTLRYGVMAGEKAEAAFAIDQAIKFYKKSLEALPRAREPAIDVGEADLLERLGGLQLLNGMLAEGLDSLRAALVKAPEPQAKARLLWKRAEAMSRRGDFKDAIAEIDGAKALLAGTQSAELGRVISRHGSILVAKSDYEGAKPLLNEARQLFEAIGGWEKELGVIWFSLGLCDYHIGAYDEAIVQFEKAQGYFETAGDTNGHARVLNATGAILKRRGNFDGALVNYNAGLQISERTGDVIGATMMLYNIGNIHFHKGELERATEYYNRMLENYRKMGAKKGIADALTVLGNVKAERGDYEGARKMYEEGLAIGEKIGDPKVISFGLGNIGMVNLMLGDYEEALKYQKRRMELAESMEDRWGIMRSNGETGHSLILMGRFDESEPYVSKGIEIAKRMGIQEYEAICMKYMGMLEMGRGSFAASEDWFVRAIALMEEHDDAADIPEAYVEYARMLLASGNIPSAREKFLTALGLFEGLGLQHRIKEVNRILADPRFTAGQSQANNQLPSQNG